MSEVPDWGTPPDWGSAAANPPVQDQDSRLGTCEGCRRLEARVAALEAYVAAVTGDGVVPVGVQDAPAVSPGGTTVTAKAAGRRRGKVVDYQPRAPSTRQEVADACRRIAGTASVRLSGIDWQVLKVEGRRALLLADRVIGTGPYNKKQEITTWERCDLRRWLDEDFARSLGEPLTSRVVRVKVRNGPNPTWDTSGGNDTQDRFFLLSMEEAADWLAGKKPYWRQKKGSCSSDALIAKDEAGESAWWWLRSPGRDPGRAAYVFGGGDLYGVGGGVSASSGGVRPAFWLNLELGTA